MNSENKTLVLVNFWLSAIFGIIPAAILWVVNRGKQDSALHQLDTENLNFSILRFIVSLTVMLPVIGRFMFIPIAVLFVIHVIAAIKAPAAYENYEKSPFVFNLKIVK